MESGQLSQILLSYLHNIKVIISDNFAKDEIIWKISLIIFWQNDMINLSIGNVTDIVTENDSGMRKGL